MKKIDWGRISTNPMESKSNPRKSGKEMMMKAFEAEKEQEVQKENLNKAFPIMEELFKIRLSTNSKFVVKRPLTFQSCELQKGMRSEKFHDVNKTLRAGLEMEFISIDNPMQEFLFKSEHGDEIAIPFQSYKALLTQTDIYEVSKQYLDTIGE